MKRRIVLLCLLILCLLSACGGTAEAPPGADAPGGASLEERTFVLGDLTLTLPEKVQDPHWSGPKGGVAQAEFSWGGENYVFRVKKSRRADNLSDISDVSDAFIGPEGGELAVNATRCVVDGAKGYIAWNVRGYAFTLSMEASASDRKLFPCIILFWISFCRTAPSRRSFRSAAVIRMSRRCGPSAPGSAGKISATAADPSSSPTGSTRCKCWTRKASV